MYNVINYTFIMFIADYMLGGKQLKHLQKKTIPNRI